MAAAAIDVGGGVKRAAAIIEEMAPAVRRELVFASMLVAEVLHQNPVNGVPANAANLNGRARLLVARLTAVIGEVDQIRREAQALRADAE